MVLPLSMIVIRLVVSKSQGYFKDQQKYLGYVNGHVEEMYTGHDIVKAFNREEESAGDYSCEYNDKLCESGMEIAVPLRHDDADHELHRKSGVCGGLPPGRISSRSTAKISIGDIQAFIQYVRSFNQPISLRWQM